jgi:hypothetical protein
VSPASWIVYMMAADTAATTDFVKAGVIRGQPQRFRLQLK